MNIFETIKIEELKQIGQGIFSKAYIFHNSKDNKDYIIKTPLKKESSFSWLLLQQRSKTSSDFAYYYNSNPNILIPRIVYINEESPYSAEECAMGEEVTKQMIIDMSDVEKKTFMYNLAMFINDLHQSKLNGKDSYPKGIKPFLMGNKDIIKKIKKSGLWKPFQIFLKKSEAFLIGDVVVPIHGDIAPRNLFYNKDNQKISLLDFGTARMSSVYVEFISIGSNLYHLAFPDNFVYELVDVYNSLPKPNVKINIDKEILRPLITSTATLRTYPYTKFQQPFVIALKLIEASKDWNKLGLKQLKLKYKLKKEYKSPIDINKIIECSQEYTNYINQKIEKRKIIR